MTHAGFIRTFPLIALVVLMTFTSFVATPACSQTAAAYTQQATPSGAGMQAGAALSTILYFPFKAAFAIGGGLVGGLAYLFSGLNEQTAKSIWVPSMDGT